MLKLSSSETFGPQLLSDRVVQRLTATLLVLYCVAQAITILTRIASGSDMDSAADSIAMIAANHALYTASKISNLVAAFLLLASGILIYPIFRLAQEPLI